MRTTYCNTLHDLMLCDERVFALTADIGYRNFDTIIADFPDRFINVGIAEANMIGIAAGLALSGKIPFAFTIAPFVTMRCMEHIRVDLCYQNLPVKIIGAGGGFVYGSQGTTHHAIEEIGMLRVLPHMTLISPADPLEVKKAVRGSMALDGPVYIRIGRNNETILHLDDFHFQIGQAITMREGNDLTIIAHGLMVKNSLLASEILAREGISARVVNMHTIKPVDLDMIIACAEETKAIITVEEHNVIGGVGSAVAEVLSENLVHPILFKRLGLNDIFLRMHATHEELQQEYSLDSNAIALAAKRLLFKEKKVYPLAC